MPSMPYCSMCMPIGWNGLSMPTEVCSVWHAQSISTNRHTHRTIGHAQAPEYAHRTS